MKISYKNYQSSAGFTLIELLVAASITTIVVTLAGSGLVAIMQNNSKAQAETLRRIELNRALDFMADEVRQAKSIATDASANLSTVAPSFTTSTEKKPVLTLEIPGVFQRVIYYTASPAATSFWSGPKVIHRWGPPFDTDGNYTNATNPAAWDGRALVDLIADTTPALATTCPTSSWSPNPSVNNGQGFTACVDPTGKIAEIYLRGKLADAYGNALASYQVSNKVFARSVTRIMCTVPDIITSPTNNTAANLAIINAGLIPKQNTVSTGTVGIASNQFPSTGSSVTCNTTVTYDYHPS